MDFVGQIIGSLFLALILIIPVRKTFERAGLSPRGAYWLFLPLLGFVVATAILSFSDWPNADQGKGGV